MKKFNIFLFLKAFTLTIIVMLTASISHASETLGNQVTSSNQTNHHHLLDATTDKSSSAATNFTAADNSDTHAKTQRNNKRNNKDTQPSAMQTAVSQEPAQLLTNTSVDTHSNQPQKRLNDTHQNDGMSEKSTSEKLEQVPYSALGVLPTSEFSEQFSYGSDELQSVYVWHGQRSSFAEFTDTAIIFVHGGCWLNAYGYEHAKGMYSALAARGIGVYATEYRRVGDNGGGWPGSLNDVTLAVKTALQKIEDEGRYSNVYLVGHSAGGHLALLAAQQLSTLSSQHSQTVLRRTIGLAAITDITAYAIGENSCQTATKQFMNSMPTQNVEAYIKATPEARFSKIPITLLQGDADNIVPSTHATLKGAQKRIIKGGGHFDWLHPQSISFDALLEVISEHDE